PPPRPPPPPQPPTPPTPTPPPHYFTVVVDHRDLHCVGIRVCDQLERLLWRRIPHAVITSATLRSLNRFDRISELSGL
ncbi:hypothetical protein, partial [Edwardsiella piscicida]|uniref:hypothetical protein n=1 Tax=Edwardsiella piscicida TaxID=1263550 RepID=UPI0011B23ED3